MFFIPRRIKQSEGHHSLVDNIPFTLPVRCAPSPVMMAAFPINSEKAAEILPSEIHPLRLWNGKSLLMIAVINYLETNIGKYIEYSIGIPCTKGLKPAPRLVPALFQKMFNTGQYVIDLPVSTEVSVKGGKGIWGMPKHIGNLNFRITEEMVSSQYDLDGQLVCYLKIDKPNGFKIPFRTSAANYCGFRGMLMKSYIYFTGTAQPAIGKKATAKLVLGDHPRADILKSLEPEETPLFTGFIPDAIGTLDDHMESWFIHSQNKIETPMQGLESVVDLGLSEEWPAAPSANIDAVKDKVA